MPKHAAVKRRTAAARRAVLGGTVVAMAGTQAITATAASAATDNDFARLRSCESGGNYSINTGNGFYGAYQFDLQTWHGLGFGGQPNQASPGTQDAAAHKLYNMRGWEPWPTCSRRMGLSGGPYRSTQGVQYSSGTPRFNGVWLSTRLVGTYRWDTYALQQHLRAKGWSIGVDGYFGQNTAWFVAAAQHKYGVSDGQFGVVGPKTWNMLWTR
jgi:hypothetical protein